MVRRKHPKFHLTIISRICVRVINRMNAQTENARTHLILNLHAIEWFQLSACKRFLINVINI